MAKTYIYYEEVDPKTSDRYPLCFNCAVRAVIHGWPCGPISIVSDDYPHTNCSNCGSFIEDEITI